MRARGKATRFPSTAAEAEYGTAACQDINELSSTKSRHIGSAIKKIEPLTRASEGNSNFRLRARFLRSVPRRCEGLIKNVQHEYRRRPRTSSVEQDMPRHFAPRQIIDSSPRNSLFRRALGCATLAGQRVFPFLTRNIGLTANFALEIMNSRLMEYTVETTASSRPLRDLFMLSSGVNATVKHAIILEAVNETLNFPTTFLLNLQIHQGTDDRVRDPFDVLGQRQDSGSEKLLDKVATTRIEISVAVNLLFHRTVLSFEVWASIWAQVNET